jgi:uncharacterized protein YjdB
MSKIIELDGRIFELDTDLTPDQESIVISKILTNLSSGCGTITKGTTKNIKCTASGGTGKYMFELYVNGTKVSDSGSYVTSLPYTFTYTFNTIGSISVTVKAKDDCSGATQVTDSCNVTVTESVPTLSSITLIGCGQSHLVGESCTITATCKNSAGTVVNCPSLTWTSSNPSIATVSSSGKVTAISEGTSNITAASSGITSQPITVTVSDIPVTPKYKCVDNKCTRDDANGTYTTSDCDDKCETTTQPSQAGIGWIIALGLGVGYLISKQKKST